MTNVTIATSTPSTLNLEKRGKNNLRALTNKEILLGSHLSPVSGLLTGIDIA